MKDMMAIKLSLTVSALTLLAACAATTDTTLSDGTVATLIECDVTPNGLNYCFERAGKSCGAAGYTIVDQDGQAISKGQVADSDQASFVREYAAGQGGMLIKCGS